jgi:hypothetical protein
MHLVVNAAWLVIKNDVFQYRISLLKFMKLEFYPQYMISLINELCLNIYILSCV